MEAEESLMKSKCFSVIIMIVMLALLCASAALADEKSLVLSHVAKDYPHWKVSFTSHYGSGRWNGELAWHVHVGLYRVEDDMLVQKTLHVLTNPPWEGEEISYDEIDLAPVPLSPLAAERIEALTQNPRTGGIHAGGRRTLGKFGRIFG